MRLSWILNDFFLTKKKYDFIVHFRVSDESIFEFVFGPFSIQKRTKLMSSSHTLSFSVECVTRNSVLSLDKWSERNDRIERSKRKTKMKRKMKNLRGELNIISSACTSRTFDRNSRLFKWTNEGTQKQFRKKHLPIAENGRWRKVWPSFGARKTKKTQAKMMNWFHRWRTYLSDWLICANSCLFAFKSKAN